MNVLCSIRLSRVFLFLSVEQSNSTFALAIRLSKVVIAAISNLLVHKTRQAGLREHYSFNQQNKMETKILRVVRQGEAFGVQSSKSDNGSIQKCNIVLRELGGSKFENEYVCAMLGNLAACKFYEGDVVAAPLRFSTHEYQGQTFQEILATDIVKLKN